MGWRDDLNYGLAAFGVQIPDQFPLDHWVAKLGDQPAANTTTLLAVSSVLFLLAERGYNPKVNDIYDAMVYCSTCFSVGYGDIFARTPLGKLIGTTLMTIGPAITNKFLDGPASEQRDATQKEILSTLQQLLAKFDAPQPLPADSSDNAASDPQAPNE